MTPRRCCAKDCFNSKLNTKDIEYFPFPRSEFYAHKWAIAAGRSDLTLKSLQNLSKYHLCAEHFTADSFVNPPYNTKLKKTLRPLKVPMPTIFKNNMHKFDPCCRQIVEVNSSDPPSSPACDEPTALSDAEDTTTILVIPELLAELARSEKVRSRYSQEELIEEIKDAAILDEQYCGSKAALDDDEIKNEFLKHACRLCAGEFDYEQLTRIFTDRLIHETVDFVLPDQIKEDDGCSDLICPECLEKASKCVEIIKNFRKAQVELRKSLFKES